MPRTFLDDIAADAANVFLTDFAETVERWPLGVELNAVEMLADITRLEAERIDDQDGEKLIYRAILKVLATVSVNYRETHRATDLFRFDSKLWAVERPGPSDVATQEIHVKREELISTKQARTSR